MANVVFQSNLGKGLEVSDNKLQVKVKTGSKITLSDEGLDVTLPEAAELNVTDLVTKLKAEPTFKTALLELLKGEEVKDLAGVSSGFLLKKDEE